MTRVLRAIGVAILITATLHASAGLCLCHGATAPQASAADSHHCCLPVQDAGGTAVGGVPTCCHVEAVRRDMTPIEAIQLAPPSAVIVAAAPDPAAGGVAASSSSLTVAASPPIQVLRL